MNDLERLAELLRARTAIDDQVAVLTGRPTERGHTGEYIAAAIFGIRLHESASHKGSDGYFLAEPLAGRSVDIKWYAKHFGLLDINPAALCDYLLVMTGPASAAVSSRGSTSPWIISHVFLFDLQRLVAELQTRGVKVGIATSVYGALWRQAEIYPETSNPLLILSVEQRRQLALFAPDGSIPG